MKTSDLHNNFQKLSADKSALLKKEKADREEKRRIERFRIAAINPTYKDAKGELVYIKAEEDPAFIGGDKVMMDYLQSQVKFPEEARQGCGRDHFH